MRRPLGQQVRDIGIWYGILEGMTYLSVVFNAFIIALTSDFIPKMVYTMVHSEDYSLDGYINFTLSSDELLLSDGKKSFRISLFWQRITRQTGEILS